MITKQGKFYCDFCGACSDDVRMVTGPAGNAICANCIGEAAAELARTSKNKKPMTISTTPERDRG